MARDYSFKYSGSRNDVKQKLRPYIYGEDPQFNELTIEYLEKYAWLYFYKEDGHNFITIKFSKHFTIEEIDCFIEILDSLGFQLDDDLDE